MAEETTTDGDAQVATGQDDDKATTGQEGGDGGDAGAGEDDGKPAVPEGYANDDGTPNTELMIARLAELEGAQEDRPDAPEGYAFNVPADLKLPDGQPVEIDDSTEQAQAFRAVAHELKMPQAAFDKLVGIYAKGAIADLQAQEAQTEAQAQAVIESLGEKAQDRLKSIRNLTTAKLGTKQAKALTDQIFSSKESIEAFETLVTKLSGGGAFGRETGAVGTKSTPGQRLFAERGFN